MADIKIAAILRAGVYSPNHIGNDAAILNLTAEQLRKRGCEVRTYSEEQLLSGEVKENIIVNMGRLPRSQALLQRMEDHGALVINSAYGVENCTRERLTRILQGCGIPAPESVIVNTNETVRDRLDSLGFDKAWIKRGDHTMHKEDVTYVRHPEEAQEVLQEYFLRGIPRAVICRHVEGDLLKFYGVAGMGYFHCYFHFDRERQYDAAPLTALCERTAEELGIKIYGGDAIVGDDGSVSIIDFNDWPSFAPFRAEASAVIARAILAEIRASRH